MLYRLFLTFNSTSWMLIIYAIKSKWTINGIPVCVMDVLLILASIFLSKISICLSKYLSKDNLYQCEEFNLADNEFLPVYLGYFFVSLSIGDFYTLIFLFMIVFIFTFLSQTQYFNPLFILFKYHYYHVLTSAGTKIFIIYKGKIIRNKQEMSFECLFRINDTTFIGESLKKDE